MERLNRSIFLYQSHFQFSPAGENFPIFSITEKIFQKWKFSAMEMIPKNIAQKQGLKFVQNSDIDKMTIL